MPVRLNTVTKSCLGSVRGLVLLFLLPFSFFAQGYFQQRVEYKIQVTLNDVDHELSAFEELTYYNNSDDTLEFLYFHLWPNAYRATGSALARQFLQQGRRDFHFAPDREKGYIDSLDFRTGDIALKQENDPGNPDICKLILPAPLMPGDKIKISTPFHVKLPSSDFSRMGHDGNAYYISQWYPKPAVYDEEGWNPMPYLDQGEFYSEFGSFDVSITLPKNYVLAATGERYDAAEEEEWLNRNILETEQIIAEMQSKPYYRHMEFPESSKEFKTIRFRQDQVHDFAWFADKRFHVLRGEVVLPHTKRSVKTWAYFTDDKIELWKDAIGYLSDATFYYSLWNGDYAYNDVSAVDGIDAAGGGMEYPMITMIGRPETAFGLDVEITHEVGHNWFYGMLATNERKHAWMDEGINTFNEMRYVRTKYPRATIADVEGRDSTFKFFEMNRHSQAESYYYLYAAQAGRNADQPCELPAGEFTETNYAAIVYCKTALLFNYLMNYMGEEDFDVAMQFYFEQCKMKHPDVSDLRKVLEYFSEKKLGWFFDCLIKTTKKLDYQVLNYSKDPSDGTYLVNVKNAGEVKGPVPLCATRQGKVVGMVWYEGFEGSKVLEFPPAEIDAFQIDYFKFMPEVNRKNNRLRTRGLLKRAEPLKIKFLGALDDPKKTQAFFAPAMAFNMYNGFMLGAAYYNHAASEKKFETEIVPMYSFGDKNITGLTNIRLNFHPSRIFSGVKFEVQGARFAYEQNAFINYYNKIAPGVSLELKKKRATSLYYHKLGYRFVFINKQYTDWNAGDFAVPGNEPPFQHQYCYGVNDFYYQFGKQDALVPYSFRFSGQANNNLQKVSVTYNQKVYVNASKYFQLRASAGNIFYMSTAGANPVDYRFRMSGWRGYNDYLYDNSYFGRSETYGLAANQFAAADGAMKSYSALGQTARWLVALNIKSPKLFKLPLLLYVDAGTCADDGFAAGMDHFMYSAGLDVVLFRDIFEVYVPLLVSKNIQDNNTLNGIDFVHQIRFTFNINRVNPFSLLKQEIRY